MNKAVKEYLSSIGRKGGKTGTGEAKRRGKTRTGKVWGKVRSRVDYYQWLGARGGRMKAANREEELKQNRRPQ